MRQGPMLNRRSGGFDKCECGAAAKGFVKDPVFRSRPSSRGLQPFRFNSTLSERASGCQVLSERLLVDNGFGEAHATSLRLAALQDFRFFVDLVRDKGRQSSRCL